TSTKISFLHLSLSSFPLINAYLVSKSTCIAWQSHSLEGGRSRARGTLPIRDLIPRPTARPEVKPFGCTTRNEIPSSRMAKQTATDVSLLRLPDLFDLGFHFLRDVAWKGRVGERSGHLLTVVHHPVQKVRDDLALRGILRLSGNQQPCETGDGIGL